MSPPSKGRSPVATKQIEYPSSPLVRRLNTVVLVLSFVLGLIETLTAILQQAQKSRQAKDGIQTALLLTVAGVLVRRLPGHIRQARAVRTQLQRS